MHRRWHHDKLTFGLLYAFSENFVLPLSHDEVVHGKGSIAGQDAGRRMAAIRHAARLLRLHVGRIPGKKLLFMGQEFGQRREWNFEQGLDWHLLADARHARRCRRSCAISTALPRTRRPACPRLRGGGLPLDRRRRCRPVGLRLAALRRRGHAARWPSCANFTPVPRARLSHRAAARRALARDPQHRRVDLWRIRHGAISARSSLPTIRCMACRRPPRSCCRLVDHLSGVRPGLTLSPKSGSIIRDETKRGTRRVDTFFVITHPEYAARPRTRWPTCWPADAAAG